MFLLVLLLLILVPVVELVVMFKVAAAFGWLETLTVLILISIAGAWLVKRQGLSMLMRIQGELHEGKVPTKTVVDGLLLLVAGVLMLTPGFVTDVFGLLLIFPPTRIALRSALIHRYRSRVDVYRPSAARGRRTWTRVTVDDDIIDAESFEEPPRRNPSGELDR